MAANVTLSVVIVWNLELDFMPASATKLHYWVSLIKNAIIKFCGAECTAVFTDLQIVVLPFMEYQRRQGFVHLIIVNLAQN